jgi:hypothetical protein
VRSPARIAREYGSRPDERKLAFECDALLPEAPVVLYRAVGIDAPPAVVFRWLCQLRAAPYSYDLLDNFGRRSPRELTPGLDELEVGQRFMTIFRLAGFTRDRQITLLCEDSRLFGDVAVTYLIVPRAGDCRLVVKVLGGGRGVLRALMRPVLPYGDVVMMRKQLLTLKRLAEESVPG